MTRLTQRGVGVGGFCRKLRAADFSLGGVFCIVLGNFEFRFSSHPSRKDHSDSQGSQTNTLGGETIFPAEISVPQDNVS
jgi:hypothetical protein